jgi:spore germination cell wall hydrolase CwlJ-like protein
MRRSSLKQAALVIALTPVVVVAVSLAENSWQALRRSDASSPGARPARSVPALSALEPQLVKPLTPEEAEAENAAIALTKNGVEGARPFAGEQLFSDPLVYGAALDCLTAAVYYEAAIEAERGQRAVAQVVLNRVRHPAFPATVCGVVYQGSERKTGCQFTFTCDGSLARRPSRAGWDRARAIAAEALAGYVEPSVGMATHYHADWVVPYWAHELDKIAISGTHIFYRWPGYWGRRQAFAQRYAGETLAQPGLANGVDPLAVGDPVTSEFQSQPSGGAPTGLLGPESRPVKEDEQQRELVVDQAYGGLIVDERPPRLARDADTDPPR